MHVWTGGKGYCNRLARVTIVDSDFHVLYNKFVRPTLPVADYLTEITGITKDDVDNGKEYVVRNSQQNKWVSRLYKWGTASFTSLPSPGGTELGLPHVLNAH